MTNTIHISEATSRFMYTLQEIERTGEVEPLVELFSDDAELLNLAMVEPLKGKEGTYQFWKKYLSVFDKIHSEFTNVVEGDNTSIMEWVSRGTLSTHQDITYRGVSILEFNDGKIFHFRTYYDSAAFLTEGAK